MSGDAMFGEDVKQEETSEFFGGDLALGQDEDTLFREVVNDNQDHSVTVGLRELFDEVHRDGIPVSGGDRQGLKPTVGFVPLGLVLGTCDARLNVRPYHHAQEIKGKAGIREYIESVELWCPAKAPGARKV